LQERRNVLEYSELYVREKVPERIARVWLIAGSRWQRNVGKMSVKNIKVASEEGVCEISPQ
jgi:hypothetical protein